MNISQKVYCLCAIGPKGICVDVFAKSGPECLAGLLCQFDAYVRVTIELVWVNFEIASWTSFCRPSKGV